MNSMSVAIAFMLLGLVLLATDGDAAIVKRNSRVASELTDEERLFVSAAWNKMKEVAKGAAPALLDAAKTAAVAGGQALLGKLGK